MQFLKNSGTHKPQKHIEIETILSIAASRPEKTLHEHEAYELFDLIGIVTPKWHFHESDDSTENLLKSLPHAGPFVAKVVVQGATHKTELKGIAFNVTSDKAEDVVKHFLEKFSNQPLQGILFVEQVKHDQKLANEILIGAYEDPFFGPCINLGFGGTSTEYYKKIMRPQKAQFIVPAAVDLSSIKPFLKTLPLVELLEGRVRGTDAMLTLDELMSELFIFQKIANYYSTANPKAPFIIEEMEINPAVVVNHRMIALDGVLSARKNDAASFSTKPLGKIKNLLNPTSVAIAGASGKNPLNLSNIILKKLLKNKIPQKNIYLIHPQETEIEGIACTKDLPALLKSRGGKPVDCLIVGVPAKIAGPMVLEALDTYAAHSLQIISAGFGETEGGRKMQDDLTQKLASLNKTPDKRPVINGPNTLGNIYRSTNTTFTQEYKSSGTGRGKTNTALVCQSGAFMVTRISDLADIIAPEIAVSVGNQIDLSVADFLEHLLNESDITAYGLYIEGLNPNDGLKLMRLIREAKTKGKFVVVYKSGRTKAGMEAAKGHTAAMSGDYDMFRHLLCSSGALVADTLSEFDNLMMLISYCDGLKKLSTIFPKRKLGIAALSNAGFERCVLADQLMAQNPTTFELASYTDHTKEKIKTVFAERGITGIVDIQDILDLSPMMNDEGYEKIIRATLDDKNVDIGIYSIVPETFRLNTCEAGAGHLEDLTRKGSILNRLIGIKRDAKKPFVISFESGSKYNRFASELMAAGIPCFRLADAAARAVAKLLELTQRP